MMLYCVVILAIYISFSAFFQVFFNVLCCTQGCMSLMSAPKIGRETPTGGSYFFRHVVITKKQYLPGLQGCSLSCRNIPFIWYCVFFINEGFWLVWNSPQNRLGSGSPGVRGQRRSKQLWLVVCLFNCVQRQFWLRPSVLPLENAGKVGGTRLILTWELVWLCQARTSGPQVWIGNGSWISSLKQRGASQGCTRVRVFNPLLFAILLAHWPQTADSCNVYAMSFTCDRGGYQNNTHSAARKHSSTHPRKQEHMQR